MMSMSYRFALLMSFAACLVAGPTATLTGRVTDPSGGVIPGVKVEATNVETNVTFPIRSPLAWWRVRPRR